MREVMGMEYNYDVAVIGGGPGGYTTAIRLAQYNKKVVLFEGKKLGGTCLNVGCIPSKAMLRVSEVIKTVREADRFGVLLGDMKIDFNKVNRYKDDVVNQIFNKIQTLLHSNGVEIINEYVTDINGHDIIYGDHTVSAENIILATGSVPFVPPIPDLDKIDYETTDTIFSLETMPETLVIVGGGVVGVEMAQAFALLGTKVTLLEGSEHILMSEDIAAGQLLEKSLTDAGVTILNRARITSGEGHHVFVGEKEITFDKLLIATGRKTNLELAEKLGLKISENKKFIEVNDFMQTSIPHIYAIGDIIPGFQLAHAAIHEGFIAAAHIAGQETNKFNQNTVPRCIYTNPEIASFGLNEETAKNDYDIKVTIFNLEDNSKAITYGDTTGFVKIISNKENGEILGAVVCGTHATELIAAILAVKNTDGTIDDLNEQIFAYPTVSEAIGESAEDFFGLSIHRPL